MAYLFSGISLVVSIIAVVLTVAAGRRRLFVHVHEQFASPQAQANRRLLADAWRAYGRDWPNRVSPDELDRINNGLSLFDLLGYLTERHAVRRSDALVMWGPASSQCWERGLPWIEYRRGRDEEVVWRWFERLQRRARRHGLVRAEELRRR